MILTRNVARLGEIGEVLTRLWWGNLRERDHGRPRRRWEDNIKIGEKCSTFVRNRRGAYKVVVGKSEGKRPRKT